MKTTRYIPILAAAAGLMATSCVKDTLYDTPHPDHGKIAVTADWSALGEGIAAPAAWAVAIGDYTGTETSATHTPDCLFEPGDYMLTVWSQAEGITVNGTVASVDPATGSNEEEGPYYIGNAPGLFCTSAEQVIIGKDCDHTFTASMQRRVRDLRLELEVTQGRPELIESVTGILGGIAGAFDMEKGRTTGEPVATVLAFTRDGSRLTADARLLGTMGDVQTLTLDIVFTDGGRTQRTEVDLTEALADFNGNMNTVLAVKGNLETPVGMEEGNAEIIGWKEVDGGEANADL